MKKIIYQILPRLWGNGRMSAIDVLFLGYLKGSGLTMYGTRASHGMPPERTS